MRCGGGNGCLVWLSMGLWGSVCVVNLLWVREKMSDNIRKYRQGEKLVRGGKRCVFWVAEGAVNRQQRLCSERIQCSEFYIPRCLWRLDKVLAVPRRSAHTYDRLPPQVVV